MVFRGSAMFYAYKRFRGELLCQPIAEPQPDDSDDEEDDFK